MKRVGVVDVAKECGVSPSTVCRALNEKSDINSKTRERILKACRRIGYAKNIAASNLRLKSSNVIVGLMSDNTNELYVEKLFHLKQATLKKGFKWQLHSYSNSEEADGFFQDIVSSRPAGIVTNKHVAPSLLKLASANQIRIVAYDTDIDTIDSVTLDRSKGIYELMDRLIKRGRRGILRLGWCKGLGRRVEGYQKACEENGVPLDESLLIDVPFGRDLYAYGYEQTSLALKRIQFDAVFAVNDACAIGSMRALREHGLSIPEDVAVVGFDDIMVAAYATPPLTTVVQPTEEMAEVAIEFLIRRIREPDIERQTICLPTTIVWRQSA